MNPNQNLLPTIISSVKIAYKTKMTNLPNSTGLVTFYCLFFFVLKRHITLTLFEIHSWKCFKYILMDVSNNFHVKTKTVKCKNNTVSEVFSKLAFFPVFSCQGCRIQQLLPIFWSMNMNKMPCRFYKCK